MSPNGKLKEVGRPPKSSSTTNSPPITITLSSLNTTYVPTSYAAMDEIIGMSTGSGITALVVQVIGTISRFRDRHLRKPQQQSKRHMSPSGRTYGRY
ncbi:uncharacterized protein BDW70DRAFT_163883 [Aspergillus foveolatus]|uniref:uncharacterized protein n=1 Tax=Aspergillus foveolatus TaxID=210207 RepID=UPI003CCCC2AD